MGRFFTIAYGRSVGRTDGTPHLVGVAAEEENALRRWLAVGAAFHVGVRKTMVDLTEDEFNFGRFKGVLVLIRIITRIYF